MYQGVRSSIHTQQQRPTMVKHLFSPDLALSVGLPLRFPETSDEVALAEHVLANELNKLSMDEHERILFDIHGLPRFTLEDDPKALEASLRDLDLELDMIENDRDAFDEARRMNPSYVDNPKFRLMFLRAENYDAHLAAETIIFHFSVKQRLFGGGDILARDVRQTDLNRLDLGLLGLGFTQVLPRTDAAGRTVIAWSPEFQKFGTKKAFMEPISRAVWYFNMTLMQDEERQKNGTVLLMYNFCDYQEELDFNQTVHDIRAAVPQRVDACHFCFQNPKFKARVTGCQLFIDSAARFRLRAHSGTPEEINFGLQTFGIPTEDSPMGLDGKWSTEFHHQWMASQRAHEMWIDKQKHLPQTVVAPVALVENDESNCSSSNAEEDSFDDEENADDVIAVPRRFDVLFGKGKREREHTGTLRVMHICEMHREKYEAANKYEKTEISERIIAIVHESGGRFLKKSSDHGGWVEVDDKSARDKISHFYRSVRSKARPLTSKSEKRSGETTEKEENLAAARRQPKRVSPTPSSG